MVCHLTDHNPTLCSVRGQTTVKWKITQRLSFVEIPEINWLLPVV